MTITKPKQLYCIWNNNNKLAVEIDRKTNFLTQRIIEVRVKLFLYMQVKLVLTLLKINSSK